MPANSTSAVATQLTGVPWTVQVVAWCLGLAACLTGMLGWVAEWETGLATLQFLWLMAAPVLVMLPARKRVQVPTTDVVRSNLAMDWSLALGCAALSLIVSAGIGAQIGDLPPAYHDEFSYLFQAKTLLAGRFSFPSSPVRPELFDQMHVLNEGRMACRYYPGNGLWLAPFVALGHPYWGPWLAGAIATLLVFWTGRELGGRLVGGVAGLAMALSPGVGLFGNTLLAHQPTLVGLGIFVFGITRWRRTRSGWDASLAGIGLSYAMLCRPMTAAGVGLPFGLDLLLWLYRGDRADTASGSETPADLPARRSRRVVALMGLGLPLVCGWCVMLAYNRDITGEWLTSPYQLYTDIYTPRNVYGFNNVVRGERHLGPKVIDYYDRVWTANLTPTLAMTNAVTRWIVSWMWSVDLLPLMLTTVVVLRCLRRMEPRWRLIAAAILSLHAVHVPYWYVGIMGWHYVFESAPLWCLLLATVTRTLFEDWDRSRHSSLKNWWLGLLGLSLGGSFLGPEELWQPRIVRGIKSLAHPRLQQQITRRWIETTVLERPALVLIDQRETETSHLDFVTNDPGLTADILLARLPRVETNLSAIARDFPDRTVFVASPEQKTLRRVLP